MSNNPLTESVYYILLSLIKPLHGYGIMQRISELSNSRVNMGAGTLYGAINTLLKKGWILPVDNSDGDRKKMYMITDSGKDVLNKELIRLKELVLNGDHIIKGE